MNKLMQGDCLTVMDKLIKEGVKVDMILADLPYGTTNCKWDSVIDLPKLWERYNKIIKDNGAIVLFAQVPFNIMLGASNIKMLRYEWIWQKTSPTGHLNAKKMPMKAHENILVFYKKLPTYNPQKTTGHKRKVSTAKQRNGCKNNGIYHKHDNAPDYDSTERYPLDVQIFSSDKQKSKLHPTQKPIALLEYLIKTYTNDNDLVLDNVMGSGSTGVACVNTNRNFIGIEKDEKYFNIAKNRLDNIK